MGEAVYVGVDVGGTKTHLRARSSATMSEVDIVAPTLQWRRRGNVVDAAALLDLVDQVRGSLPCSGLAVGAHGCDSAEDCSSFERTLQQLAPFPVRVVNDAELFVPAARVGRGIGLVAGTGSIAVGRGADNAMIVAGGWGWILGDEGSAAGLVREAVRAVRGSIDAGEPEDGLYDALRRSLGVQSETEFGRTLDAVRGAAAWGSHAEAVFNAASAGSRLAMRVIREGAAALALLVQRVANRGAPADHVVAAGGVIVAQPLLYELFQQELARRLPQATPTLLTEAPVAGAVVLARTLATQSVPFANIARA